LKLLSCCLSIADISSGLISTILYDLKVDLNVFVI